MVRHPRAIISALLAAVVAFGAIYYLAVAHDSGAAFARQGAEAEQRTKRSTWCPSARGAATRAVPISPDEPAMRTLTREL